jgi:hypothetical protein
MKSGVQKICNMCSKNDNNKTKGLPFLLQNKRFAISYAISKISFIAITKATACGLKEPLLPHPLHSPVGGRGMGGGGAGSASLKFCIIKT